MISSDKNVNKIKVVMCGPHLTATSGISNVVNNWLEVGLAKKIDLKYIATLKKYVPGRYFNKLFEAVFSYISIFLETSSSVDIFHIHISSNMSFFRKLIIFEIATFKKKKTIIHLHGSEFEAFYNNSSARVKKMIKKLFDSADAVVVLSKSWKKFVESISVNKNIYIIYNGANLKKYAKKIINRDRINISFMGRLGKRKGAYDLLRAFERIVKNVSDAHLIFGGDGDIDEMEQIVMQKNLKGNVHVLGWVSGEDKVRVFRECDIYVLPSYNEGLPGSVLEAMGVGVPVISTPVGGIPEAVIENRNGFLIQPGDVDSLAERLIRLCSDCGLRDRMGIESRKIMRDKFDIEEITNDLVNLYAKVLAS